MKISKAPLLLERSPVELIDICLAKAEHLVMQLNNSCGIFDKFRDLASLDEHFCLQLTGWKRKDFFRFTNYVRDTAGRTKEQLVAIYRYWKKKGLD